MRGLLRALREIAQRARVGPYLGDLGAHGNVYTKRVPLDHADLAAGGAGLLIARSGGAVHCHPQTFAGFKGEIYFGEDVSAAAELWQPLSRCQISTPPNGEGFKSFRVRLVTGSNSDAANELVLVVDPAPYGSEALEAQPPTPEVGAGGGAAVRIRAIRRSDGAEADVEAGDGSTGTRGTLGVAGLDAGSGDLLTLGVSAARRLLVNLIAGQDGVAGGAGNVDADVLRVALATDDPVRDAGAAGATTLRTAPALTASAAPTIATAGAASSTILAANARRTGVMITNRDAEESVYLNFGATAAAAASGVLLEAGESITFTTTQAITAIRGGAADVSLEVIEESA